MGEYSQHRKLHGLKALHFASKHKYNFHEFCFIQNMYPNLLNNQKARYLLAHLHEFFEQHVFKCRTSSVEPPTITFLL